MENKSHIKANYLDALWRFFASLKLTVIVFLTLAVLAGIGTFLPQNQSPTEYFRAFGAFWYQILANLDMFDLYHAWWFRMLILILVVNIVICSIDRLRHTWKIIFARNPHIHLEQFLRRPSLLKVKRTDSIDRVRDTIGPLMKRTLGRYRTVATDDGFALTADHGRWTRLGVYVVHLSVIVLLVGSLAGSMWGFDGYVNLPEQESIHAVDLRDSSLRMELPFTLRCDDFKMQVYDNGAPKEWRVWLTILENGRTTVKKDIIVNDPLRYKGINIFLSSYGIYKEKPAASVMTLDPGEPIQLHFQSRDSGIIYDKSVKMNETAELPEGLGTITVTAFAANGTYKGVDIGPALTAQLMLKRGGSQTISLPLGAPRFDAMREGAVIISATARLSGTGTKPKSEPDIQYYAGLQITKDPGVGLVYAGFILMITGCFITFFTSHRQVVVAVKTRGKGCEVLISGTANKNKLGLQVKLERLADRLKGA